MQKFSTRNNAYLLSGAVAIFAAVYVAISVGAASKRTREALETAAIPEISDSEKAAALLVDHSNEAPPLPTWELLRRIRCSCYAAFVYGYFQAAVVLFLPSFLVESKGIASERTTPLPGIFCFGMLLASNLVGRIADKRGHLVVMRACAAIGTIFVFGFVALSDWRLMYVAVFCAGGTLAAMSPVSLALQGVATPTRDYARGNSLYNLWYASGILLGPPISGALFEHFGGGIMLTHLALLWASFVVFSMVFAADDPAFVRRREARAALAHS
jgi:predicted MFS family arabinose efflux permease